MYRDGAPHPTARQHRHQEFLSFLRHIETNVPMDLNVHLICDNYGSHKRAKVRAWRQAPTVPSALHADLQLVAEPNRTLVCLDYKSSHPSQLVRLGAGSETTLASHCVVA